LAESYAFLASPARFERAAFRLGAKKLLSQKRQVESRKACNYWDYQ